VSAATGAGTVKEGKGKKKSGKKRGEEGTPAPQIGPQKTQGRKGETQLARPPRGQTGSNKGTGKVPPKEKDPAATRGVPLSNAGDNFPSTSETAPLQGT